MRRKNSTIILAIVLVSAIATGFLNQGVALTWSQQVKVADTTGWDSYPATAQARDGKTWLVWQTQLAGTGNPDIYAKQYDGVSWGPDQPIIAGNFQDVTPSIAKMANGSLIIVWASNRTGGHDIYYRLGDSASWGPDRRLTTSAYHDEVPAVLSASDGSIWVVWQRDSSPSRTYDLYYKVLSGGAWQPEQPLVTVDKDDAQPSITQAADGKIFVAWYSQRQTDGNADIFYKYWNGGAWSSDCRLANSKEHDNRPSIVQDRTGTTWIFWTKEVQVTGQTYQWELYYSSTTNPTLCSSWTPEATLFSPSLTTSDEKNPAAFQNADGKIWLMYQSNFGDAEFEIYWITSNALGTLTHDVAVTFLTANTPVLQAGETIGLTATLENNGNYLETVQLDYYLAGTVITSTQIAIPPGGQLATPAGWTGTDQHLGRRTLSVQARQVPGETNTSNNSYTDGMLLVVPLGDRDKNGAVDQTDFMMVTQAFDSEPGDPNWNPVADVDGDGDVDINDGSIVAIWFGWTA